MKCQLEAYKNEMTMMKQEQVDAKSMEEKDKQIRIFQQTLRGMQQVRARASLYTTHCFSSHEIYSYQLTMATLVGFGTRY